MLMLRARRGCTAYGNLLCAPPPSSMASFLRLVTGRKRSADDDEAQQLRRALQRSSHRDLVDACLALRAANAAKARRIDELQRGSAEAMRELAGATKAITTLRCVARVVRFCFSLVRAHARARASSAALATDAARADERACAKADGDVAKDEDEGSEEDEDDSESDSESDSEAALATWHD